MGAATQGLQLDAGFAKIRRLVEPCFVTHQNLVSADNHRSTKARRNLASLCLGQSERTAGCIAAGSPPVLFQLGLIERSRFDAEIHAGASEQPSPCDTR